MGILNSDWYRSGNRAVFGTWPKDEAGEPVPPALLTHVLTKDSELSMLQSMLESFGIPSICDFPNDGRFGMVVIGNAGGGADVYVPRTLLEDAQNIMNSDNIEINEEEM